ncbi:MAG TPA: cation transporter [Candidatus Acidoferrales bacterium]|nr:cation transporter [Candidatus Acidoferrales bacterium]
MFGFVKKKKVLNVEGMTCHHCEMTVEKALLEVAGVKSAKADHAAKSVEVEYKNELDLNKVREKIAKAGYRLAG